MESIVYKPAVMKMLSAGYNLDQVKEAAYNSWSKFQANGGSREEANERLQKAFGLKGNIDSNDVGKADFMSRLIFEPMEQSKQEQPKQEQPKQEQPKQEQPTSQQTEVDMESQLSPLGVSEEDIATVNEIMNKKKKGSRPPQQESDKIAPSWFDAWRAGYQNSVTGLFVRDQLPEFRGPDPESYVSQALFAMGQMLGDMPVMAPSFLAASAAGTAATGPVGGAISGWAAAGAVPGFLRSLMLQAYKNGEATSFPELLARAGNALVAGGKDGIVGAVTGAVAAGAGGFLTQKLAKPIVEAGGKLGLKTKATIMGGAFAAEAATMGTVAPLLDARLPTASDFISSAVTLAGLKGMTMGTRVVENAWIKYGWTPDQTKMLFKNNPYMAQDLTVEANQPYYSPERTLYQLSYSKGKDEPVKQQGPWLYYRRMAAEEKQLWQIRDDIYAAPKQKALLDIAKQDWDNTIIRHKQAQEDFVKTEESFAPIRDRFMLSPLKKMGYGHDTIRYDLLTDFIANNPGKTKAVYRLSDWANKQIERAYPKELAQYQAARDWRAATKDQEAIAFREYNNRLDQCPPTPTMTPLRTVTEVAIPSKKMFNILKLDSMGSPASKVIFRKFALSEEGKRDEVIQEWQETGSTNAAGKSLAMQQVLDKASPAFQGWLRKAKFTIDELKELQNGKLNEYQEGLIEKKERRFKKEGLTDKEIAKRMQKEEFPASFHGIENMGRYLPLRPEVVHKIEAPVSTNVTKAFESMQKMIIDPKAKTFKDRWDNFWNKFEVHMNDRFAALNKYAGKGEYTEAYVKARMAESCGAEGEAWFTTGAFEAGPERKAALPNEKPLEAILKEVPDMNKLASYLIAENTIARARQDKPILANLEDARLVLDNLKNDKPYLDAIKAIQNNTKALLKYAYDSGLYTKEKYKELSEEGPIVPVERLAKNIEEQVVGDKHLIDLYKSVGMDPAKEKEWFKTLAEMRKEGKNHSLYNPLESMIMNVYTIMRAVRMNETHKAIALEHGLSGQISETNSDIAYVKGTSIRAHKITYKENGENVTRFVLSDVYDAVRALDTSTQSLVGRFWRAFTQPAQWLRAGVAADPGFALYNMTRDQFGAGIQTKTGYAPFKNMFQSTQEILKGKWSKDFEALYNDAARNGAFTGTIGGADRNYIAQTLSRLMERPFRNSIREGKYFKAAGALINPFPYVRKSYWAMQQFSEMGESGPRLAEYARALQQGYTKEQAAFMAREITQDFSRGGTSMRAWNAIVPFANARWQGTLKSFRAAKENPIRFMAATNAFVIMPTLLLAAVDADIQCTAPDSEFAKASRERPAWHRAAFWMFPAGDNYSTPILIPKPHGLFAALTWPFEFFIHEIAAKEKFNFMEALAHSGFKDAVSQVLPMDAQTFVPHLPQTMMEVMLGKSLFTGNAIVPSHLQKLLPEEQYTENTSALARGIGNIITRIDRLAGDDKRWISDKLQSPVNIDYVIKAFGGNLGKHVIELIDQAGEVTGLYNKNKPAKDISQLPIVKEWTLRFPNYNMYTTGRFYEVYDKYKRNLDTIKHLMKSGNATDIERAKALAMSAPALKLNMIEKALTNCSTQIRVIQSTDKLTPQEKRENIDKLLVHRVRIAKTGLQLLQQFQEKWDAEHNR